MIFDIGKNIRRYGKVGFYIPEKGRQRKIFGNGKYFFAEVTESKKRRKVFLGRKYFLRRRKKSEMEKGENIWERKIFFGSPRKISNSDITEHSCS